VTCGRAGGRRTRWRATTWATRARPAFPLLFGSPHRRLQLRLVLYSSLPSRRPLAGSSPLYSAISRSASAPLLAPSPGPHLFLCGHASMYGGGGARTLAMVVKIRTPAVTPSSGTGLKSSSPMTSASTSACALAAADARTCAGPPCTVRFPTRRPCLAWAARDSSRQVFSRQASSVQASLRQAS
jgi:hypothetical protein